MHECGNGSVRAMIAGLEAEARVRLEPEVYDYVAGGSGAEVSLAEAERAWQAYRLLPRVLRDVSSVDTSVEILGVTYPSPVALAPVGYQELLHPDGEVGAVSGAGAHLSVVSARADHPVRAIGDAARRWWYQVYVTADRSVGEGRAEQAAAAGATALVLTGDTPFVAAKARTGRLRELAPGSEQAPATPVDIRRLGELTGLPVLVKGVLRADDAKRVLDAGAAGIVVSNHGGRQLDRAAPTAEVLPHVVAAAGDAPVLVDGGLRSGHDVLVALALGARAVLVGRPAAWALATGGAHGVGTLLDTWTAELREVLGLAGCRSCGEATADLLHRD